MLHEYCILQLPIWEIIVRYVLFGITNYLKNWLPYAPVVDFYWGEHPKMTKLVFWWPTKKEQNKCGRIEDPDIILILIK